MLARCNDSPYGLASGIFSTDMSLINTLTRGLRAGTVWVNTYNLYDRCGAARWRAARWLAARWLAARWRHAGGLLAASWRRAGAC